MRAPTITADTLRGLLAVYRYRLLSVDQFARASNLKSSHVRDVLRSFERTKLLGSIGNVGLRGGAKAPKLYYLTKTGYEAVLDAGGFLAEDIGPFVRAHTGPRWSPLMAHRMATIDLLLAAESSASMRANYRVVSTFHEYRRITKGRGAPQPETTDYVLDEEIADNRIVPDAAFVLENEVTGNRGLYFVETDRATERLTSGAEGSYSIVDKLRQYERYLRSGRFATTYEMAGDFNHFVVLFVTLSADRVENIRQLSGRLDPQLHQYFKLGVMTDVLPDLLGPAWAARDPATVEPQGLAKREGD